MACVVTAATPLLAAPDGEVMGQLSYGDQFELLELAGGCGWGTATAFGLVGYCDRAMLELA